MRTDPFPSARMIEKAVSLGIPLTFSSDAHRPDEVTYAREQTEALFVAKGVTALACFVRRQRVLVPLITEPVVL
jgi:histidinol-phosphatase (PHP family)